MAAPRGMCQCQYTDLRNAITPHSTSHPSVFTITELKLLGPSLVPRHCHQLSVRTKVASSLLLLPEDIEEPHHLPVMVWRVCLGTGSWGTRGFALELLSQNHFWMFGFCHERSPRTIWKPERSAVTVLPEGFVCGLVLLQLCPSLLIHGLTLWVRGRSQACTSCSFLLPSPSSFSGSWARLMPISAVKGTSRSAPASLRLEGMRGTPGQICPCSLPLNIYLSFPTTNSADFKLNTRRRSNCPKWTASPPPTIHEVSSKFCIYIFIRYKQFFNLYHT